MAGYQGCEMAELPIRTLEDETGFHLIVRDDLREKIPNSLYRRGSNRYDIKLRDALVAAIGTPHFPENIVDAALQRILTSNHKLYTEITGIPSICSRQETETKKKAAWMDKHHGQRIEVKVLYPENVNGLSKDCVIIKTIVIGMPDEQVRYFEVARCLYDKLRSPYGYLIDKMGEYREVQLHL